MSLWLLHFLLWGTNHCQITNKTPPTMFQCERQVTDSGLKPLLYGETHLSPDWALCGLLRQGRCLFTGKKRQLVFHSNLQPWFQKDLFGMSQTVDMKAFQKWLCDLLSQPIVSQKIYPFLSMAHRFEHLQCQSIYMSFKWLGQIM